MFKFILDNFIGLGFNGKLNSLQKGDKIPFAISFNCIKTILIWRRAKMQSPDYVEKHDLFKIFIYSDENNEKFTNEQLWNIVFNFIIASWTFYLLTQYLR